MKTFNEFLNEEGEGGSAPPTNTAGSGNIAGIGIGPQGEPGRPKKFMKLARRKKPLNEGKVIQVQFRDVPKKVDGTDIPNKAMHDKIVQAVIKGKGNPTLTKIHILRDTGLTNRGFNRMSNYMKNHLYNGKPIFEFTEPEQNKSNKSIHHLIKNHVESKYDRKKEGNANIPTNHKIAFDTSNHKFYTKNNPREHADSLRKYLGGANHNVNPQLRVTTHSYDISHNNKKYNVEHMYDNKPHSLIGNTHSHEISITPIK